MDFSTIKKKLNQNNYKDGQEFISDMKLVFDNCDLFNGVESDVGQIGVKIRKQYKNLLESFNFNNIVEEKYNWEEIL